MMTNEVATIEPEHTAIEKAKPTDPMQSRIDAVACLTKTAYERASMLEMTDDEMKRMQADFPDEAFRSGAAGKDNLIYIEHAYLRDRMNEVFGPGRWSIIPRNRWTENFQTSKGKTGIRVYVEAMLVIRGCFVSEAIGDMDYYQNDGANFGDAVEGAKTAALRRCAKELGIGLQAWKKSWCEGWWKRLRGQNTQQPKPTPQPKVDVTPTIQSPTPSTNGTPKTEVKQEPPKVDARAKSADAMISFLKQANAKNMDELKAVCKSMPCPPNFFKTIDEHANRVLAFKDSLKLGFLKDRIDALCTDLQYDGIKLGLIAQECEADLDNLDVCHAEGIIHILEGDLQAVAA